jgi:hypothetical protein
MAYGRTSLWPHDIRPLKFPLVVDDFGVMYVGREHAEHLMAALGENYEISTDWTDSLNCGITMKWNYVKHTVDLSMLVHVKDVLRCFQYRIPLAAQAPNHQLWSKGTICLSRGFGKAVHCGAKDYIATSCGMYTVLRTYRRSYTDCMVGVKWKDAGCSRYTVFILYVLLLNKPIKMEQLERGSNT